ncbi:hypothetical protein [Methylotuvimicrobium buryatense]|uniref:Uncharacterized protein n=1 Tax=Methylotuvimicrobium buryatense TaxID=95641 RepID=A0A4P9UW78_METBY|nr:hypothetical protein [Methylotuvimicrobium buryatense]QCW84006.1 hypothetical protein EQU24_18485 [Methylotuvimicrobium buryatense]
MFFIEKIKDAGLDYWIDQPNEVLSQINEIKGWIAIKHNQRAFLIMKSNDSDYILPLNIVRNDVVAFLKNKEIETHQLCGFEYKINSVDEIQLCIENEIGEKTVLARLYKSAKSFSKTQKSFEKDTYPFFSVKNLSVFTQTKSLSELLLTHDYDKSLEKIKSLVESNEILKLQHPIYCDIETYAVVSERYSVCNFILYKSTCGKYDWILVQVENFVDAMLFPDLAFFVFSETVIDQVLNSFQKVYCNDFLSKFNYKSNSLTSRFFLGHPRPFHFIYDQYFNFWKCSDKTKKNCKFYADSFFLPSDNKSSSKDYEESHIYYALNNVGLNFKIRHNGIMPEKHLADFENYLFDSARDSTISMKSTEKTLKIWIGITGQKRAWKEQIEGYVKILNNLSQYFETVEVLIDGWTAVNKALANDTDDLLVVHTISSRLKNNISTINLVGFDYEEKIQHAHGCDVFIANAGSGAIVPLRIAKLDGALHSNPALVTFPYRPSDTTYSKVKTFLNNGEDGLGMNADYSVDWKEIYNHIAAVLSEKKNKSIPMIDLDLNDMLENVVSCTSNPNEKNIETLEKIRQLYDASLYFDCYLACLYFLKNNPGNKEASCYLFNSRVRTEPAYSSYITKCLQTGFFSKSIKGLLFNEL